MWQGFVKELRRYLDGNNVGLYSLRCEEQFYSGDKRLYLESVGGDRVANNSIGTLTVLFEDSGDYARFVKERAVNFKLSVY